MKKVKIEAGIAYYYNPEKKKNEVIGIPQVVENKIIGIVNPEEGLVKIHPIITQIYYGIQKAGGIEKSRSPVLFIQNKNCIPKVDKYLIY